MRDARPGDADAIAALANRASQAGGGFDAVTAAWLRRRLTDPDATPGSAFVLADRAGDLVGFGSVTGGPPPAVVELQVVAGARGGRALGAAVLAEAERRARSLAAAGTTVVVHAVTVAGDADTEALHRDAGYVPGRTTLRMRRQLDGDRPPPSRADLAVVPLRSEDDLRRAHACVNAAFADHFGAPQRSFASFRHAVTADAAAFDPSLWFLGFAGDELAGLVHGEPSARDEPAAGYVRQVAVAREHRRRGIAALLMRHAFAAFAARGAPAVVLFVDAGSETGAVALYEGLGMRAEPRFVTWRRELRGTR
jgi:mycothiol synthase